MRDLSELLPQGRWAVSPEAVTFSNVAQEPSTDPGVDQAWTSSPTTILASEMPANMSWHIKSMRVLGDTAYVVLEAPGGFVQTRVFVRKSVRWHLPSQSKL